MFKKLHVFLVCAFLVLQYGGVVLAKEDSGKGKGYIALVNGEAVLPDEFEKRLNFYRNLNPEIADSTKKFVLDQIIDKVLLRQFVKDQGLVVSVDEIQAELEKVKLIFNSGQKDSKVSLEKVLESRGSSILQLRDKIRNEVALSKYLDKNVKADDLKAYFDSNLECFNGEEVRASHILVDTRGLKSEEELAEASGKIEKLAKDINDGADFAELAKKNSDCPSSENGGDLGFFEKKGSMVAPFANAAFLLKKGEVSKPVKTQYGLHLIKVTDRRAGEKVIYDDNEEIKEKVERFYMEEKKKALLENLRNKAQIEIFI